MELRRKIRCRNPYLVILCLFACLGVLLYGNTASAGQATLTWTAPTTSANGTALTDLAGYRVYYGTASRTYASNVDVGNVRSYTVPNLTEGTKYYFAVKAYDTSGNAGVYSNEMSKTMPLSQATLTVAKNGTGSGSVTSTPAGISCGTDCSQPFSVGASVTLTASPAAGSAFAGWSGGCTGTGACTVAMTASKTVTAAFNTTTATKLTITASAATGGTITPAGAVAVNKGASQTFTIAAASGYKIDKVLVDGVSKGAISSYTFTNVIANHSIQASFASTSTNEEQIIDNLDPETSRTGSWQSSGSEGFYGTDSVWSRDGATFTWHFTPLKSGTYEVAMWWTAYSTRSTTIPVDIQNAAGTKRVTINQQQNGAKWNTLGSYAFTAGSTYKITVVSQAAPTSTCADAVKFSPSSESIVDNRDAQTSKTGTWQTSSSTGFYGADSVWSRDGSTFSWNFTPSQTGNYDVSMWWSAYNTRSTSIPVDIQYSGGTKRVTINQQQNGGKWNLLGTYPFAAGVNYKITITSQAAPTSTCADAVKVSPSKETIIDNRDTTTAKTGTWQTSSSTGFYGADSVWSRDGSTFTWRFTPARTGSYQVSMWWSAYSTRSTSIPVDIQYAGGTRRVTVNQQQNGGTWNLLGTHPFEAGKTYNITITSQANPTSTCADAVKFSEQ